MNLTCLIRPTGRTTGRTTVYTIQLSDRPVGPTGRTDRSVRQLDRVNAALQTTAKTPSAWNEFYSEHSEHNDKHSDDKGENLWGLQLGLGFSFLKFHDFKMYCLLNKKYSG